MHFLSAGRRVRLVASFSEYVESLFIRIEARMHAFVDEWMNSLRVIWGADLTPRGRVIIQNLNIISARSKTRAFATLLRKVASAYAFRNVRLDYVAVYRPIKHIYVQPIIIAYTVYAPQIVPPHLKPPLAAYLPDSNLKHHQPHLR